MSASKKITPKAQRGGWVACLGWCRKKFYTRDRSRYRLCETCLKKRASGNFGAAERLVNTFLVGS